MSTEARGRPSTSPIALAFELESALAAKLGVHPIAEARPTIRLRISSETPGLSLRASDTTPGDTLAMRAMSLMVGRLSDAAAFCCDTNDSP